MMLAMVIYLIDNVCGMKGSFWDLSNCVALAIMSIIFVGVFFIFNYLANEVNSWDGEEKVKQKKENLAKYNKLAVKYSSKVFFWTLPIFIVGSILNTVIPSKETAYKMLAAYGVEQTVIAAKDSEYVQRMAGKSLKLIEQTVDKYLSEEDNVQQNQSKKEN